MCPHTSTTILSFGVRRGGGLRTPWRSSLNRLSTTFVAKTTKVGLHSDGNGLYLQVTAGKRDEDGNDAVTKSWIFRYAIGSREQKRERKMGLGPYPLVTLATARKMAIECSLKRLRGIDPLEEREAEKRKESAAAIKTIIFEKAAEQYIAAHQAGWKSDVHRKQWKSTLETYSYPVFGKLNLRDIDTGLVVRVLQPIWTTKTETASRLRGRIENILDWGKVNGYRDGENPARWDGHLDYLLPKRSKVRKEQHHPALPYVQMPQFIAELRGRTGVSAKCLEFVILTLARTTEAIKAKWTEIDFNTKVWTPALRADCALMFGEDRGSHFAGFGRCYPQWVTIRPYRSGGARYLHARSATIVLSRLDSGKPYRLPGCGEQGSFGTAAVSAARSSRRQGRRARCASRDVASAVPR